MTYKINGVSLHDPVRGWKLLRSSTPVSALEYTSTLFELAGRDGATSGRTTRRPTTITFDVETTTTSRPHLLALLGSSQLTITTPDRPNQSITGRVLSTSVINYHEALNRAQDSFVIEVPDGAWRSTETTTSLTAAAPAGATMSVFTGMSAPVQDALVRLNGPLENPQVVDSSGAFIAVEGTLTASQYLRFDSNTGRAWTTTTDTWTGGTEVSGLVDFGGPRGVFEITPKFTDPAVRAGQLTLTQLSYNTGAGFQVRGRAAYLT